MKNKLLFALPFLFVLFLVALGLMAGPDVVVIVITATLILAGAAVIGAFLVTYFGD